MVDLQWLLQINPLKCLQIQCPFKVRNVGVETGARRQKKPLDFIVNYDLPDLKSGRDTGLGYILNDDCAIVARIQKA